MSEHKRTFTAADIASVSVRNTAVIDAPELGPDVQVRVRGMMAGEYMDAARVQEGLDAGKNADVVGVEFIFNLFRKCVVDDDGNQVFRNAPEDIAERYPVALVTRVATQVMELSEMNTSDLPESMRAKVEEALKEAGEPDPDSGKGSTGDSGNSGSD